MTTYKITLRTGHAFQIDDQRTLGALAGQLAHEGFVIVQRRDSGYSQGTTEVALAERAVERMETASP